MKNIVLNYLKNNHKFAFCLFFITCLLYVLCSKVICKKNCINRSSLESHV